MRNRAFAILLSGFLALGASAASAANNPLITVDELGFGTLEFPVGSPIPTIGVLLPDPGPGGLASALTYNLLGPPALVAGDLIVLEAGSNGIVSDIVRFNPVNTGSAGYPASLVFYSDDTDGVDALADTGLPLALYTNVFTVTETGPEGGPNGVTAYTPTENQPGFVRGFSVTYTIRSDPAPSLPEPATVALLGVALVAFSAARRRKSN